MSRIARIVSKYCSAPIRRATALPSGISMSRWAILAGISRASRRDAPALQERHEEHARRRQVEDVFRPRVLRSAHLHDLERPEEVAPPLEVPDDDDAVRDRLLHAVRGVPLMGGRDLRHEEGRASDGG